MFTKTVKTELRRIISLIVVGAFLITQASPVWALAPSTGFEDDIDTQSAAKLEEFKIETATITEVLKTFPDLPAEIKGQVMDAISKGKSIADIQERLSAIEGLQPEIKDRIVAILDEKVLEAKQADEAAEGAMREEVGQASFDILVRKLEGEIELRQQYEQAESIAAIKSLAESHARIIEQLAELDDNRVIPYLEELLQKLPKEPYYGRGDAAVEKEIVAWGVVNITIQMQLLDNLSYSSEINPAYKAAKVALAKLQNKPEGAMREAAVPAEEAEEGVKLAKKLQMPLNAQGDAARAARFLEGGYNQRGLGVAENAAVDGSRAIGNEGDQGYYVGRTADGRSGREVFLSTVSSMSDFFKRRAQILGKTIKYVIKPGIGGQHTPFQGIADVFQVIDPTTGVIVGEYELGKDYEAALSSVLAKLGADWDQVAVIPSSKSGSTDETMMIFVDVLNILLKHIAEMEVKGINGEQFAKVVLDTMHQVNFPDGKEKPGKDLFKGFSISLVGDNARAQGLDITNDQIKAVFGKVLGNMFFETTDRPQASRLSAFIRNSGLDTELGDNVPGFGAMFDNVGGRWTGDLHMMAFLAFHNLDAAAYWDARYSGIQAIREGTHVGNRLGNTILDKEITDIALVVPDELFWFGKSIEQNFNESIWQQGFANLVAVKQSQWEAQKNNYVNQANRLVVNLSGLPIQEAAGSFKVFKLDTVDVGPLNKQDAAIEFAKLFNAFYGATQTAGDRLIARALHAAGYTVDDVDMSDLDNPATQIVQQNLYLRQPYVELGKGLLEARLKALQQRETEQPGAIALELDKIKQAARDGQVETNIADLKLPEKVAGIGDLVEVIRQASAFAESQNRKLVPFIYLEGDKFYQLREQLIAAGLEWVMQGTGDQHISYQQVLAQPQKYLPLIVSVVPEQTLHGQPAIGFAKGYLNNVSPNMVRDFFAEASYRALTDLRKDQGGWVYSYAWQIRQKT